MNVALLNERVTFQKNEIVTDSIGNHTDAWTDYYECAATISGEGGGETAVAGQTVDRPSMNVTVRWCEKTKIITSTGYRILFHGKVYDIESVDHFSYKKDAIKFTCRRTDR